MPNGSPKPVDGAPLATFWPQPATASENDNISKACMKYVFLDTAPPQK
jgi:hypothetical protein